MSAAGAVIAVALIVLGAMAVYGGNFGQRERAGPAGAAEHRVPAGRGDVAGGEGGRRRLRRRAGRHRRGGGGVLRYIGGHLVGINEGATYSETSAAAREEGLDPDVAAELQGKADTLFKGETLRAILLNAYGWWTVATIALWAGFAMVAAGLLLGILSILGFRHGAKVSPTTTEHRVHDPEYADATR